MDGQKTVTRALSMLIIATFLGASALHSNTALAVPAISGATEFALEFSNCVESIGVTLVSTERARSLIPPDFHLVGDAAPVTPLVVRTARCDIAVAGQPPQNGSIAQIGLVVVPPDFTGDINNYTLWYYTTDAELANHLVRFGVGAQHVQNIEYGYVQSVAGSAVPFSVNVPRPGDPTLLLGGTVMRSDVPSGSFVANWWQNGRRGNVKMNTNVPSIYVGSANLTLTTDADNELAQLIGSASTGFPILQQFNTFAGAHMDVTLVSH